MAHPVHVLEQGADVQEIVNMAAVAVIDAQWRVRASSEQARVTTGEFETATVARGGSVVAEATGSAYD